MEDLLSVDRLLAVWNAVFGWLRTNVFVLDTAIQAGVIALTLLLLPGPKAIVETGSIRDFGGSVVVFGEVGLTGEIRPVPFGEERLAEAEKHGFKRAIVPRANVPRRTLQMEVVPVDRLSDALAAAHER